MITYEHKKKAINNSSTQAGRDSEIKLIQIQRSQQQIISGKQYHVFHIFIMRNVDHFDSNLKICLLAYRY